MIAGNNFFKLIILFFVLLTLSCSEQITDKDESLITISPSELKAGTESVIEITLTVPHGGISKGGSILFPFYMKPWDGLIKGISDDKFSNRLVNAFRSDSGNVDIRNVPVNREFDILSDLRISLPDKGIDAGEKIVIRFGTPGEKMTVRRKQKSFYLEAELDANGDGKYVRLFPPDLRIKESEPASLHLVAPSFVKAGEKFNVIVYAEDKFLNVCEEYSGVLEISSPGNSDHKDFSYTMHNWDRTKDLDRNSFTTSLANEGVYYLEATDENTGLKATSNPIKVVNGTIPSRLIWGEIHVHSQLSDGRGELQDLYRDGYARGLDFMAITDHSFGRDHRGTLEERISEICRESDRFNRPGEFVTIPAGETHYLPVMHMNMYFDRADTSHMLELIRRVMKSTDDLRHNWQHEDAGQLKTDVQPYWDVFRDKLFADNTLVFPHHTMWLGIRPFLDEDRMRVIEIFSIHGTSEVRDQEAIPDRLKMKTGRLAGDPDRKFSVREVLDAGMHLGFVGGSDNHEGQPGVNAITGIYTNELNRESIIKGIYDQHCYATSANRTLIDIRPEGSAYNISINGDGQIDQVEIIGNGKTIFQSVNNPGRQYAFNYKPVKNTPGYFYVRVTLNNGTDAAWSSPIRVE